MLKYDTLEQAQFRLRGSVILYQGRPCYVENVARGRAIPIRLTLHELPISGTVAQGAEGPVIQVDQEDPELDFRIFQLGYMNDEGRRDARFITRASTRQQHQGLTRGTLHPQPANNAMLGVPMRDLLMGVYPDVDEAFKRINEGGWSSCAISRDFAVGRSQETPQVRTLLYRGRAVGVALGLKFQHFLVNKEDAYLAEALQEAGFPFEVDETDAKTS